MLNLIAAALVAAAPVPPAPPANAHAQHQQMGQMQPGQMKTGMMDHGDMAAMMEKCCTDMMAKMHGEHAAHQGQPEQQQNHKQ